MPTLNTARGRWLVAIVGAWLVLGSGAAAEAQAPADEPSSARSREAVMVIGPGREADAAALIAPVRDAAPPGTAWRGPQIDVDRIHWWLKAGDETRASLTLVPRALGSEDAPRSESFAIEIDWAPDSSPSAAERALMDEACAAIQANDRGDFYGVAIDNALAHGGVEVELDTTPSEAAAGDPDLLRRRWALRVIGVLALGLMALGVAIRGLLARPADSS